MRHARSYFGTAVADGKIYAIGGLDKSEKTIGAVERYDPQTNSWTDMSSMPIPQHMFVAVCSMGKIYCISEWNTEVYDIATDSWEEKLSMPTPRSSVSVCVVNGSIYVMGGFVGTSTGLWSSDLCEVYDPVADAWSVFEGVWPEVPSLGMVFDNWEYSCDDFTLRIHNLVLDSWMDGPGVPGEFHGRGIVEVGGLLYALGGCTETYSVPFYIWHPERVPVRSVFVYTPFGYGRVAPVVSVLSLEDGGRYDFSNVTLEVGLKQSVVWVGYSLDGHANVTVDGGGVVLSGLSNGRHSVRVFAEDKYGNVGASETITFSVVNAPLSLSFITAITALVVVAVVVCGGLLLFLRKRRRIKFLTMG